MAANKTKPPTPRVDSGQPHAGRWRPRRRAEADIDLSDGTVFHGGPDGADTGDIGTARADTARTVFHGGPDGSTGGDDDGGEADVNLNTDLGDRRDWPEGA